MLGVALGALMVSGAFAQSPGSNSAPSATPPATSTPSATPPAANTPSATPPAASTNQPSGKPEFVTAQKPDQLLASSFKGTDVVGNDDKKIGDVSDVLFDKQGKIEAYVVSIGGFLGMGAKSVAMAPTSFEVVSGTNGGAEKLKLAVSQDELKQAQNFTPYQPPRPATTTGSGSPMGSSSGLGSRPSTNGSQTGR
jgi:sporulation protein YlmC with PRC-barrel domain